MIKIVSCDTNLTSLRWDWISHISSHILSQFCNMVKFTYNFGDRFIAPFANLQQAQCRDYFEADMEQKL